MEPRRAVFQTLIALALPFTASGDEAKTVVTGRIAAEINQHLIGDLGKDTIYFDVEGGDQIVAYAANKPVCDGRIELTGKMIEVKGPSKRPGERTKVDDAYSERQMDVSSWRCLPDVAALLNRLADKKADAAEKEKAKKHIVAQGKDALPVLIAHLDDARLVRQEDIRNYYNRPPGEPMPKPLIADVTVGREAERMLYDLITPPPSPSIDFRGKVFGQSILRVNDWKAWWDKNKSKTLEQIRKEMQPLVDRYWEKHGTEQIVPY